MKTADSAKPVLPAVVLSWVLPIAQESCAAGCLVFLRHRLHLATAVSLVKFGML